jgi:hypothetical protein
VVLLTGTASHAQQLPLLESLDERQLIEQMQAAPQGDDQPLEELPVERPIADTDDSDASEEEPSVIEQKVAEGLQEITLEDKIQQQVVQPELSQFGYDLFEQAPTTFAPVTELPVPSDYIVGPGDTLIVQVFGKLNVEYKLVVTATAACWCPSSARSRSAACASMRCASCCASASRPKSSAPRP